MKYILTLLLLLGCAVSVEAANVTSSVTANVLTLDKPGPVTLTWSSTGAGKCTATGDWSGVKNLSGSEVVQITKTMVFNIMCESPTGPAKVSWVPPTTNNDGSTLTTLKGFVIFNGPSATAMSRLIDVPGGSNTSVQVQVTPGLNYFMVHSVDQSGVESADSNTATKNVVVDTALSSVTVALMIRPMPPTNVTVQ